MAAPVWMALPPEVHSALLSAGVGPASLLSAAVQWRALAVQYGQAAVELSSVLAQVQAGAWEGVGAEQYLAAHLPYLAWLEQSSSHAAVNATQHEAMAAAYGTALATMPSMAELTANHAINGVLVATNFFGVNTIPIALNEADYARMWVQAAETMTVYQAVSETISAALPAPLSAPPILKADIHAPGPQRPSPSSTTLLEQILRFIEQLGSPEQISQLLADFQRFFEQLGFNPSSAAVLAAIALVLYDMLWYPYYASYALLLAPFFAPALSALGALALLKQVSPDITSPTATGLRSDPVRQRPTERGGEAPMPMTVSTPAAPPSPAPAQPAARATTGSTPATAPAAGYAVMAREQPSAGADPGVDIEDTDTAGQSAAAVAAAHTQGTMRRRDRRTRKARDRDRGYRHEFLDVGGSMATHAEIGDQHAAAGGRGAVASGRAVPKGLVARSPGEQAAAPMLPGEWRPKWIDACGGNFWHPPCD